MITHMIGQSHDYKRHGTTTLFGTLNVVTGKLMGRRYKRRRRVEFLDFIDKVASNYPDPVWSVDCGAVGAFRSMLRPPGPAGYELALAENVPLNIHKKNRLFCAIQLVGQNGSVLLIPNLSKDAAATDVRLQSSMHKRIYPVSRFIKLLSALVLVVTLSPLAAHAKTAPRQNAQNQTQYSGQTAVQSGANYFRDTFSG